MKARPLGRAQRFRPLAMAALAFALALPAVTAVAGPDQDDRSVYLVELAEPAAGLSVDRLQASVLAGAGLGAAPVRYRYRDALTGFAAELTPEEAGRLAGAPGVKSVSADRRRPLAQASAGAPLAGEGGAGGSPADFLSLPGGLWARLGGPGRAGEGIVVGVVDTGIDPSHPSFADTPERRGRALYDGPAYPDARPPRWKGACQAGDGFPGCNNKVIGARYFVEGFGRKNLAKGERQSPLDSHGHGSHTAATAAGNHGVPARVGGVDVGRVSGIAPRALLAAYKVCWVGKAQVGDQCADSDVVAAIDAAVADGVDVLNLSLGVTPGGASPAFDAAMLRAAEAGVFVVEAVGNDGPGPGSVGLAAPPWITTVAATTHGRGFSSTVTLSAPDGAALEVSGPALTAPLAVTPLVAGAGAASSKARPDEASECAPGSLSRKKVKGRVVVCQIGRGEAPGQVVADAGGAGLLLFDRDGSRPISPLEPWVPSARLTRGDGEKVLRFLADHEGARAEVSGSRPAASQADVVAPFSSRGPARLDADVLAPSLAAPGVNVLAATTSSPVGASAPPGEEFALRSGTSMASPQVAGASALLRHLHPERSPAQLRSQLMTTAVGSLTSGGGVVPAGPFDSGAGRIDPNRAADAGLVLDIPADGYRAYRSAAGPSAGRDLNLPGIVFGGLPGVGSVRRTVQSVDGATGRWTAAVVGLDGMETTVAPAAFEIAPGAAQPLEVAFRRNGAPFGQWAFGAVTLTHDDGRRLRLPVAVKPVGVGVPPEATVFVDQPSGTAPFPVATGFSGQLSAVGLGLAAPVLERQQVSEDRSGDPTEESAGVQVTDLDVPAGTKVLAVAVSVAGRPRGADLDLVVLRDRDGDGFGPEDVVGVSATSGASEMVMVPAPEAARYRISVVGFRVGRSGADYDLATWLVADPAPDDPRVPAGAPGLSVGGDPQPAEPGGEARLTLEWDGVPAGPQPYLGLITFEDGSGTLVSTSVLSLLRVRPAA